MKETFTDEHGVFCEIDGGRIYEVIHGKRCIQGTASRIRAQRAHEQSLADCEYILEFSDKPEGMVSMWRDRLCRHENIGWNAQQLISRRAEEIQGQRKTAKLAAE